MPTYTYLWEEGLLTDDLTAMTVYNLDVDRGREEDFSTYIFDV